MLKGYYSACARQNEKCLGAFIVAPVTISLLCSHVSYVTQQLCLPAVNGASRWGGLKDPSI